MNNERMIKKHMIKNIYKLLAKQPIRKFAED